MDPSPNSGYAVVQELPTTPSIDLNNSDGSVLTQLLNMKDPAVLQRYKNELADRIFTLEDSNDNLTPIWRYVQACLKTQLPLNMPRSLDCFIILFVVYKCDSMGKYIRDDYAKQPNADLKFLSEFWNFFVWCMEDYRNMDPEKYAQWLICYNRIRTAWLTKTIPSPDSIETLCTHWEKKIRKTNKREERNRKKERKRNRKRKINGEP